MYIYIRLHEALAMFQSRIPPGTGVESPPAPRWASPDLHKGWRPRWRPICTWNTHVIYVIYVIMCKYISIYIYMIIYVYVCMYMYMYVCICICV